MPISSSAAPAERPRVVSTRALTVFGALAAAGMVLLFPYETLVRASLDARNGDALAVAYLHNLLRTETDNAQMRFALAAQHRARGEAAAALAAIAPLREHPDPATRHHARWLAWQFGTAQAPLSAALRDELHALAAAPALLPADRIELILAAAGHGQPAIADLAMRHLAAHASLDSASAEAAAERLRTAGHAALAARCYLLARHRVTPVDAQRRYFLAALRTLQAVSDFDTAFALADRELGTLADDGPTLSFLIHLARAANQPARAADYARALIRVSLLEQLDPTAGAIRPVAASAHDTLAVLPFDAERYQLAYDTFLAAGALADAYALAASAVRQAPDDSAWRARLAQVAEWHGQPAEALAQWHHLARGGDDAAWAQVLRLAPGLFAHAALLDAQQHALAARPGDTALLAAVAATYERLGEPAAGLRFLHDHVARHRSAASYEILATFAERAGRGDVADAALAVLDQRYGATPERSVRRAAGLIARGRLDDAMAALDAAHAQAPDNALAYWRLRASLASLLQDRAAQRDALDRLVPQASARSSDYADLVELLRAEHPDQAARVAERAWQQFDQPEWLLHSLDLHLHTRNYAAMGALIDALPADRLRTLEADPGFLRLRGQWRQGRGEFAAAQADFIAALQRAPGNAAARESLLWLLVDAGKADSLRALLARHEADWARDADLHDALAAAALVVSRPQHALDTYWLPRAAARRDDFLWMMGLADALEQAGDADRAWRVREQLWRSRPRALPANALTLARRAADLRLAQLQRPGDASHALLRALLSQDRDSDPLATPLLRDLAMSWMLEAGTTDQARAFLFERYATALTRPLWAEAAVALAADDAPMLAELLARHDTALPATQRADIAQRLGRPDLAASTLADAATDQHANDEVHLQMSAVLLDQAHRLRLDAQAQHLGSLDENAHSAQLRLRVAPRLKLTLTLGRTRRSAPRNSPLSNPADARHAAVELTWTHDAGVTRFGVGRQFGFGDTTPWWLGHDAPLDRRWSLAVEIGAQLPATESSALRVAGMKDQLLASATYGLSSRERVSAQWAHSRYASQHGLALGRADRWQLDYVHRLTTGAPEVEAGVYLGGYRFRADVGSEAAARAHLDALLPDGLGPLLPDSYLFQGLRVEVNARQRHGVQRALVPYAALDLNHVTGRGAGYGVTLGIGGAVFGADQLDVGVQFEQGGEGEAGRSDAVFLNYQLFF
ncbi:MAG: tetratricopeptide repeat protein [Rhodocyclaceae bacterium]|nr:tetratricopeptide repeat protein [Rhodocyclaceae bacterium]